MRAHGGGDGPFVAVGEIWCDLGVWFVLLLDGVPQI